MIGERDHFDISFRLAFRVQCTFNATAFFRSFNAEDAAQFLRVGKDPKAAGTNPDELSEKASQTADRVTNPRTTVTLVADGIIPLCLWNYPRLHLENMPNFWILKKRAKMENMINPLSARSLG
jgi:hypothetical protein